jgi:putative spermidine/putrescine transport system permease protein
MRTEVNAHMLAAARWPRVVARAGLTVFLLVIGAFILAPVVIVFLESFTSAGYVSFPPRGFSLHWYSAVFDSGSPFGGAFFLSLRVSALVACVACVIGCGAAFAIVRYRFLGRTPLRALVLSPIALPGLVLGVSLLNLSARLALPVNQWTILAGQAALTTPFIFQLIGAQLAGLDLNLERAARSLGASSLRVFQSVTLPLVRLGLVSGVVFAFVLSFDDAVVALFLTAPGATTLPVEMVAYTSNNFGPIVVAAGSLLIIVGMIGVIIVDRIFGIAKVFGLD